MRQKSILAILFFTLLIGVPICALAQIPQGNDTLRPLLPLYNAGFDVIIKKNGDIIYGLVQDVGLKIIKYKRTDIPNGPVYTLLRDEVYAISYRNQVKDILAPVMEVEQIVPPVSYELKTDSPLHRPLSLQDGIVRVSLGFIRTSTRVSNAGNYSSSPTFPFVNIAYDANYQNKFRAGVQLSFGSHKFSGQEYSTYDSTQTSANIRENIFALFGYVRYYVLKSASSFQPYLIGGIGITTANLHNEYGINFYNNPDKIVQVKSGSRSVGVGILARIGGSYSINKQFAAFGDIGTGPSLINIGISIKVNQQTIQP